MIRQNPVLIRNEEEETSQVRRDLIFVVSLNVVLLAGLIVLYFYNRSTGQVDAFFANLLKF